MSNRDVGSSAIAIVTSLFAIQAALVSIHRILLFSYAQVSQALEAFLALEPGQGVLF